MNNITAARDISGIAPVSVLRGISPLCVPFASGSGLADEVKRRADPNIVSLWERLGLVYLIEQPAQTPVHKTHVTVNNFTAQLVFRICSQNHTDRLIERYQPGFVFPEKIRAAGAALNSVLRTNEAHRVGEAFTCNSRYTEEISRIFRLVFEKETGGIPLQTVCRALAVLLGSTGGGAVFTAQQQRIFQRIATVLSAEYPESTAAQEIASVGAAAVFTEEQRRRILSAANVMGYNTQHEAAQRVLSLVNSGKTREEIGRVLLTEVRRYGLDGEMQNDVITSARAAVSSSQPESGVITAETDSPTEQGNGFVIPVNGVSYEMAKLLLADDFSGDIPSGAISSAAIAESSAAKVLAERLSTVKYDERFNKAFSEEITERLTKFVTGHIAGNSAPSTLTGGIAGSHQLSGTVVSLPYVSGEKLVSVTAGTSGRILNQLGSQETQLNLISHNSAESSQFSENVRSTLEIIKQYSGNQVSEYDQSNIYDNADNSDFGVNVSVVQQFSDDRSYSSQGTTEQYLDIQQTEHVDGKRGSAAVPADIHDTQTVLPAEHTTEINSAEQFHTENTTEVPKPGTVLPTERTTEIRSAEQFHTENNTEVPQPGMVLPTERTTEIRSAEQFHTENTTEVPKPGTVLPTERTTEIHSAEQFHTENTTEVPMPGTVRPTERTTEIRSAEHYHTESTTEVPQPGTVLPAERTTEIRSAEQFHTESTNEVPKPGTVLPAERTTEIHSAEQYNTESTTEVPQPGTVLPAERTTEIHSAEQFHTESTTEVPQPGTVLPTERTTEIHSAEQFHTENTTEVPKPGTVLPAERTTEIRSAEQFHTESTNEVPKPGTVLPAERTTEIRSAEQYHTDTVFTPKSEAQAAAGSFRSRLDTRTLETLDRLVAESRGQVKAPDEPQEQPAQMVLAQNEPQHSATAELSGSEVLRSVNIVRRSIVNETTTHIQRLMEKASAPVVQPTVQKPFKYRTVGGAENMVMLVPPSEMDRFRAADPYMSKLPPIELKEPQKPQPEQEGTTRKTTVNNRPVIVRSTDSSIDSLSREDLSRLADKVYERIETKLTRERRRMGL